MKTQSGVIGSSVSTPSRVALTATLLIVFDEGGEDELEGQAETLEERSVVGEQ